MRQHDSKIQFDLEAQGSRFTMRPALAIQFGGQWREMSETRSGVAKEAIASDLGGEWLKRDVDLGDAKAIDGVRGRGAAGWVPVLEWVGLQVAGLGVAEALRAGIGRARDKMKQAEDGNHRVLCPCLTGSCCIARNGAHF